MSLDSSASSQYGLSKHCVVTCWLMDGWWLVYELAVILIPIGRSKRDDINHKEGLVKHL